VKSVCLALMQSERYGTPLGQSLRVMAQENRDMRMNDAEKKAAALPPKLTVPMILFFLPVLFVVILGPSGIRVNAVAPGVIDTDMSNFTKTEAGREVALGMQALKRLGKPDDVADVVAFVASDAARWITGASIPVDGGSKL